MPKKVELRITIIGSHIVAAGLSYHNADQTALDWRTAYHTIQYRVQEHTGEDV